MPYLLVKNLHSREDLYISHEDMVVYKIDETGAKLGSGNLNLGLFDIVVTE